MPEARPKPNRRVARSLPLVEPVHEFGAFQSELVFYQPRGKTLRLMASADDEDQAFVMLRELTEWTEEALDALDSIDATLAIAVASEIIGEKQAAAATRAKELGIELGALSPDEEEEEEGEEEEPEGDVEAAAS